MVRTAFVSTYPPRLCGIATFTADLGLVAGDHEVVALSPPDHALGYPGEVNHVIRRDVLPDYARVARRLTQCVDVVSIQHEYGIWGGRDGDSVVDFAGSLGVPAVATLHTILRRPTPRQRAILVELVDRVSAAVVMSRSAADLLTAAYGVDPVRVEIIPHGVADLPLVRSESVKPSVGLAGRRVILSFGLLGPGKGYELALEALPAVAAAYPDVCYVIVGATHPDMVRREGEAYRQSLVERVERLGLWGNVRFVDRFVGRSELARWLESADVFVTPYPNLEQIVSGTLSSAMGAGRAIVSTPYTYASELLANGRGVLVMPGSSEALGTALVSLLADDRRRADLGRRAYAHSRGMVWAESGARYRRLFQRIAAFPGTSRTGTGLRPAIHA
jgi:glycosyltransferase involved in cell wall biosynthesis